MKIICNATGKPFEVSDQEVSYYERQGIPLPTLSPRERQRRRIAYRNFRSLYSRPCDATGQNVISMYDENAPFPVYSNSAWWADNWDASVHGREFDFSRGFFEQYQELNSLVPRPAVSNVNTENCEYSNFALNSRNCYLVFGCVGNESCLYGHIVWHSTNCVDALYAFRCEWCSNSVDLVDCYDVHYSTEVAGCKESYFLNDCRNSSHCFCCTNLRNAQYCILNKQYSKEEYYKQLEENFPLSETKVSEWATWLAALKEEQAVYPELFGVKNENVSGNHIYESKNIENCFDVKCSEDCAHCYTVENSIESKDISFSAGSIRFSVDCLTVFNAERNFYCHSLSDCTDAYYSEICIASKNIFGCVGMRNAKNCILNKEYSSSEYQSLVQRIKEHMRSTGEWGEFFPIEQSPFAYNESIVNEYIPLEKSQVLEVGLSWKEPAAKAIPKTLNHPPEFIDEVGNEHLKQTFTCKKTNKAYKFQKAELEFYKRVNLPLPTLCPDERHLSRMSLRAPRRLIDRSCDMTGERLLTAHDKNFASRVYSEEQYLKLMHG